MKKTSMQIILCYNGRTFGRGAKQCKEQAKSLLLKAWPECDNVMTSVGMFQMPFIGTDLAYR